MTNKETYMKLASQICEKYADDEISTDQAVALFEKASDKYLTESTVDAFDFNFGDDSDSLFDTMESADDEMYNKVVDAICEKYNDDEITSEQAVALMEKAVDKYL